MYSQHRELDHLVADWPLREDPLRSHQWSVPPARGVPRHPGGDGGIQNCKSSSRSVWVEGKMLIQASLSDLSEVGSCVCPLKNRMTLNFKKFSIVPLYEIVFVSTGRPRGAAGPSPGRWRGSSSGWSSCGASPSTSPYTRATWPSAWCTMRADLVVQGCDQVPSKNSFFIKRISCFSGFDFFQWENLQ